MEVGFKSDKGRQRQNNEDACFVLLPDKVYVVADGVGGGNAGEIASRSAVSQVANYIVSHPIPCTQDKYEVAAYFQTCLDMVNRNIYEMATRHEENHGMATTIVMVYADRGKAYITNVGDSRAYLFRDGQMTQLTEDHTYVNTLVKAGVLTEEEAATDERKNVITRALGAEAEVDPDFFQVDIAKDDLILICTDGLYDEVSQAEMTQILKDGRTMSDICGRLVTAANAHGGHDNITVISLRVTKEDTDEQ